MNIPFEIWREISLLLPYNFLSLSKEFILLYDQSWFESKVKIRYSNCKKHKESWEQLYKKSLKSGKIIKNDKHHLPIEGIKAANLEWDIDYDLILTFDGDLIKYNPSNGEIILLDSNVIDICDYAYIKEHEFYIINQNDSTLFAKSEEPFLAIANNFDNMAAITKSSLYHYDLNISLRCDIIVNDEHDNFDITYGDQSTFIIQRANGSLFIYHSNNQYYEQIENMMVKKIFPGIMRLNNDSLKLVDHTNDGYGCYHVSFSDMIKFNGKLREAAIIGRFKHLLLINDNVYDFDRDNNTLTLIHEKVKSICGSISEEDYYII